MQIATGFADGFLKGGIAAMRRRSHIAIVLVLILSACGGRPPSAQPVGFINQTRHSDAELQSLWQQAQQSVSQQLDLNPLEQEMNNAAPDIVAAMLAPGMFPRTSLWFLRKPIFQRQSFTHSPEPCARIQPG